MGKSYRNRKLKEVFVKLCGKSDKKSKQEANRKFRREERHTSKEIQEATDKDDYIYSQQREVSNTYEFASDGLAVRVTGWFFEGTEEEKQKRKEKLRRK